MSSVLTSDKLYYDNTVNKYVSHEKVAVTACKPQFNMHNIYKDFQYENFRLYSKLKINFCRSMQMNGNSEWIARRYGL